MGLSVGSVVPLRCIGDVLVFVPLVVLLAGSVISFEAGRWYVLVFPGKLKPGQLL